MNIIISKQPFRCLTICAQSQVITMSIMSTKMSKNCCSLQQLSLFLLFTHGWQDVLTLIPHFYCYAWQREKLKSWTDGLGEWENDLNTPKWTGLLREGLKTPAEKGDKEMNGCERVWFRKTPLVSNKSENPLKSVCVWRQESKKVDLPEPHLTTNSQELSFRWIRWNVRFLQNICFLHEGNKLKWYLAGHSHVLAFFVWFYVPQNAYKNECFETMRLN